LDEIYEKADTCKIWEPVMDEQKFLMRTRTSDGRTKIFAADLKLRRI
jgi:hypothetical protein